MRILRGCLILVVLLFMLLLLSFCAAQLAMNRRAEAQAWEQITRHYRTTQIGQNDRVYYSFSRSFSYEYAQICYDVSIALPSGAAVRKIVMVSGDEDGGTFHFGREYPSMAACKSDFNHG